MKKLMAVLMVMAIAFAAGAAYAKDLVITKQSGGYTIKASIDRNPPVVGKNTMTINVTDATGATVTDATVKVDYVMPAMPGMPAMNYKTNAETKGGAYIAVIDLSMAGPWNIAVKVTRAGKTATAKFNIDAQ